MASIPFWQQKSFDEMTRDEWESLCDGCAKCCLHKLEDEDTGDVYYTDVACRYLDQHECRCQQYDKRQELVEECISLKPEDVSLFYWLPSTCAYRLLSEGKPLPQWHPLVSSDTQAVHQAGQSVRGRTVSEDQIHPDDYEDRLIRWVQ